MKASDLIQISPGSSLDHLNLEEFFAKFYQKIIPEKNEKPTSINEFLKSKKNLEILHKKLNLIKFYLFLASFPSLDTTDLSLIISLLLYHACVQRENEFFQKCCKQLDARHQFYIAKFFNFLKPQLDKNMKVKKELIKAAIKEAVPLPTTPQINFLQLGSPLSTPKGSKSPSTPNREMFNEKIRELKSVKTQLENERYEKSLLETEMKQNLNKIESLGEKLKIN